MKDDLKVALLFGGVSSEHDISWYGLRRHFCQQWKKIKNIRCIRFISPAQENGFCMKGTGRSCLAPDEVYTTPVAVLPGLGRDAFLLLDDEGTQSITVDVVIPVLHGLNGEDGTVQGLLEGPGAYVGCGVLASALAMDKVYTKRIVDDLGIRQARYVDLNRREIEKEREKAVKKVEEAFSYPVFVKPSRAGSSVGVTKAHNAQELEMGLLKAAREDRRVLVEEFINGREVECAVLGDAVADVGEILAAAEFYDFEAKYVNTQSRVVIPADLSEEIREEIRRNSEAIFRGLDGSGLARVDFFVDRDTGEVVFNEINTFPGFTPISMYPMLWKDKGLSVGEQVKKLIEIALERKPSYGT